MLLLLAGTGESRVIAKALSDEGIPAVASLAGATRTPEKLPIKTRVGGFGGREGFIDYLNSANITAILDATHPFAHRISNRSAQVAAEMGIPFLQFLRSEWTAEKGDTWTFIDSEEAAADHIPEGATVFLATGRQTLDRFGNLEGRKLICRQIDPPERPFPFPNGEFLIGKPPFSVDDEINLFKTLGVDWLVVKNAGGIPSRSKLEAARTLKIPVAIIKRPPQPDCQRVDTIDAVLEWVRAQK